VPSDQKLKSDLENLQVLRLKDLKEDQTIELPAPRGGHAACLIGNPPDFIVIFGGSSLELLDDTELGSISKIRRTLNDMWVYNTETRRWS
jgi:hypothetical protein